MSRTGTPTHPRVPALRCAACLRVVPGQVRIDPRTGHRDGFYIDAHRTGDSRTSGRCGGDQRTDHAPIPAPTFPPAHTGPVTGGFLHR